jgi:8-oxo-dGTP pyrophosphatase MutT (NUDIX family)
MAQWVPEVLFREMIDKLPICTVDIAFFNPGVSETLVFRRSHPPLQSQWFTIGGRLQKSERLRDCALRHAREEAALTLDPDSLFFGGVFEEIHDESRFGGVTYHCVNFCWGYLLGEAPSIRLDPQHDRYEWRSVADPAFHPLLGAKVLAVADRAREEVRNRKRPSW